MDRNEQRRLTTLLYQMAQSLIVVDDFTILPQFSHAEQAEPAEQAVPKVVLLRRRWNTLQIVRLQLVDDLHMAALDTMVQRRLAFLQEVRQEQAVQQVYELVLFIFSQGCTDENMRAVSSAHAFAGLTKSSGVAPLPIDLTRGVHGALPSGNASKDITLEPLLGLAKRYAKVAEEQLPARSAMEWEAALCDLSERKQQQVQQALRPGGKTPGVYGLIGINVLIWLLVQANPDLIVDNGVLDASQVRLGEWWRLLTAVFLHVQISHLAFNMMSLYWLGQYVERIFGRLRFMFVFILAGIGGSLLSFALNDQPSLGASGAIFGLFGALVAFGQWNRRAFSMTIGPAIYGLLIVNLIIGFVLPGIDYWAHLGGLVSGYLMAQVVRLPEQRDQPPRWGYALVYLVYAILMLVIGKAFF